MLHTTFAKLREHNACEEGYAKLAKHLDGVRAYGETTPIPLAVILDSNGLDDTLWTLRATLEDPRQVLVTFACDCAERALPVFEDKFPGDMRPREAIEAVRGYLAGTVTREQLRGAAHAVRAAARAAYSYSAARAAAYAAAYAYSAYSAYSAARAAAYAARSRRAEREWQVKRLRELLKQEGE